MTWFDVLANGAPPVTGLGRAVLADDGSGFWWTYGVAEALIAGGWSIILTTPGASIGANIPHESLGPLLGRLGRAGTLFRVLMALDEVTPAAAHLINVTSGDTEVVACDLVVVQTGRVSVDALVTKFRNAGLTTHMIGDRVTPRKMSHAVFDAQRLALNI
jgi:2,4-dienoyl-CoA reductase (NADPH2)